MRDSHASCIVIITPLPIVVHVSLLCCRFPSQDDAEEESENEEDEDEDASFSSDTGGIDLAMGSEDSDSDDEDQVLLLHTDNCPE